MTFDKREGKRYTKYPIIVISKRRKIKNLVQHFLTFTLLSKVRLSKLQEIKKAEKSLFLVADPCLIKCYFINI